MSSTADVSMTDLATRYTAVDVGLQGTLGGFNLLRKYVSSDKTWAYQSLLGNQAEAYLPKPFGGSPSNGNSLRWWHSLYSFVYPKGWKPGVSTWAVRDTDGAVLEFEACSDGSTSCFAKPRKTTLWSHDQLYWSGSQFILFKQGEGRYVYGDVWLPPPGYGDTGKRYFLTRTEDETLTPSGSARIRLQLTYTSPESAPGQAVTGCPGLSRQGNGVPFIATVSTEDGARLYFHYTLMGTGHHLVSSECVLKDIALADNPHVPGNTSQQIVAQYFYPNTSTPLAGLLEAVSYPQTGDMVSYSGGHSTTWSVSVNNTTVATHNYDTSGKVATATSLEASSNSTSFSGSGDCGLSQSGGSPSCTPPTASIWGGSGDSAEGSVQIYRRVFQELTDYAPHPLLRAIEESCGGGNCASFMYSRPSHELASLNSSPLRTILAVDQKSRWSTFNYLFTEDASLSPAVSQPISKKTEKLFAGGSGSSIVRTTERNYSYGTPVISTIPRPTKPLRTVMDARPSVLQLGAQSETTQVYDEQTNQLKAIIQSGWTKTFDGTTWSSPVQRFIGTFYLTYQKCSGEAPGSGRGEIREVHGPCFVTGPNATDCDLGGSFPVKQYHYYPSTDPSNRANRLWKVSLFPRLSSQNSCVSVFSIDTVFNDYDARGNALAVTDPNGVTTTIQRQGGRITSMTTAGATTHLVYAGGKLVAKQHPEGNYDVFCYRSGTIPGGQGCSGGTVTEQLQWTAKAADATGSNWSESQTYEYWPDGTLKRVQYASATEPTRIRWQERFIHDGHQRLTRHYQGSASYHASVYSYDRTNNLTGVGLPFNQAPDFCAPDTTGNPSSELCTLLTYDSLDRLTQVNEFPSAGVQQQTRFSYDEQDNIRTIQAGCDGQPMCTEKPASYVYDDFGHLLEATLPHATSPSRYAYDALGNVVVKQTPEMVQRGQNEYLAYAYDGLGRPLWAKAMRTASNGLLLYALGYDEDENPPADCEQNLNSRGRLRFREDSFGRTWYQYGTNRQVQREMRLRQPLATAHCGQGNDANPDTFYTYTPNGNLASITYPHGRRVDYLYGAGGWKDRVSALNVYLFESTTWTAYPLVSNITWEPYGGLRSYQLLHRGSGNTSTVEYMLGGPPDVAPSSSTAACSQGYLDQDYPFNDWTGRLRAIRVSSGTVNPGEGLGDIYDRIYTWTANEITRIDTCVLDESTARTEEFHYDRTLRLVGATRPPGNFAATGGAYASRTYEYDRRGNRVAMTEDGTTYNLQYDSNNQWANRLSRKTSSIDASLEDAYSYDYAGRVEKKESGHRATQQAYAQTMLLSYLDSPNSFSSSPAVESVFRHVDVNGTSYSYFYDAFGRRRLKAYPLGTEDEFFYDITGALLSDRGNNRVAQPVDYHVEDDYVWLGGQPLVLIRGKLTPSWERQSDASTDCMRNGEASSCGVYFPITDHSGKPVLMLDASRRVANAADYDPFGHVNRVTQHVRVPPYTSTPSDTSVALLSQPLTSSRLALRMRALFGLMDTVKNSPECTSTPFDAYAVLRNPSTSAALSEPIGGRTPQSSWVPAVSGQVNVAFVTTGISSVMAAYEEETGYHICEQAAAGAGVALEGYEYQRYEVGAQPFWTPLRFPGHYHDAETDLFENWNRYYDPSIGRYLQPEPLLAVAPVNLPAYEYALSNPMSFGDSTGLAPGLRFREGSLREKRDAAAIDALLFIFPSSEVHKVEYGGMICMEKDGAVFATDPTCGESGSEYQVNPSDAPCPAGTKAIADYHTHFDNGDEGNRFFPFSTTDVSGANSAGIPAYLARAGGQEVWRYDPIPWVARTRIRP